MLKELIHEKIQEIFIAYQEANNIVGGDIDPADVKYIEQVEDILKMVVERICSYQPKGNPTSFYVYRDAEGIAHMATHNGMNADKFFTEVSHIYAFDDCSNKSIISIFWHGKEIRYVGWQPMMRYEYKDLDGNTVWVGQFEEWDH